MSQESIALSRATPTRQRTESENVRVSQGMMSLVPRLPLGPQKTPPDTKLRDPTNIINEFAVLARVFLFIPHHAIFGFPARIDPRRKRRIERRCITDHCRHPFTF